MAVTRDDIQDSTGQRSNIPGRGFTRGLGIGAQYTAANGKNGVAGNPIDGEVGWAPGAIFQNVLTATTGNFLWVNVGTITSALWKAVVLSGVTGSDTFSTLTVTTLLRGGTTGLTINGQNTGSGTIGMGGASDSVLLGSSTAGGNASTYLGQGAPANSTVGFSAGTDAAGSRVQSQSSFTGNVGATAYTISDLVYMLKSKGVIAF